jgi:Raf kinase inhibitor-like YbhB/YbcL family protein
MPAGDPVKWNAMAHMTLKIVTLLTAMVCIADARKIWMFRDFAAPVAGAAVAVHTERHEAVMQVTSKLISPGAEFPKRNTCQGEDVSPPLAWAGAPANTQSFALILDDPDAPVGTFTHWLVWNLPAATTELAENLPKTPQLPGGGAQGRNDFGKVGYGGPCPPPGKPHRYYFRLFALDATLAVKPGAGRRELERALEGHILARGELMGRFAR